MRARVIHHRRDFVIYRDSDQGSWDTVKMLIRAPIYQQANQMVEKT
jgi:hypothetical protein